MAKARQKETGLEHYSDEDLKVLLLSTKRNIKIQAAQNYLLPFVELTMPDPENDDDCDFSLFQVKPHHKLLAESFEQVVAGKILREAISVAPQHGKSELISRRGVAWYIGKNPTKDVIFATYSDTFAEEFGAEVRAITESPAFKQVFPEFAWRKGSKSKSYMVTSKGGRISFIGRGGAGTGKGADLIVIDDPLKNADEAESPTTRRKLHEWFDKVVYSRAKQTTAIIIIQTRWHEDDLIGRLCDPEHPDREKDDEGNISEFDQSKQWTYINIPAVIMDPELAKVLGVKLEVPTDPQVLRAFGDQPMAALWEERFALPHLASACLLNPVSFNALYMGKPTPEDGEFFRKEQLIEYDEHELPKLLRIYGASDHALTSQSENDASVIGCVGVDIHGIIWVLPDVRVDRIETDETVDEIIDQMVDHRPLLWWMESENISKSFGPFLYKEMTKRKAFFPIDPVIPSTDKKVRARSIQGRLQMKMVRFPRFAPWWREMRSQMLKFPFAAHDDFVDWMALIGLGLMKQIAPREKKADTTPSTKVGTKGWVKYAAEQERKKRERARISGGW